MGDSDSRTSSGSGGGAPGEVVGEGGGAGRILCVGSSRVLGVCGGAAERRAVQEGSSIRCACWRLSIGNLIYFLDGRM